ncbi:hypothetical protein FNFX1_0451 [Francisella cf. novicida Fx1]|nr:hypothetical protein FNFX1_0451 [Francisella cf. novicida Fx1]AKE21668.1 putative membrane protein [Francisella tularensis subsp. tularensis str. SCHU S4 substr. NR-28534]
MLFAIFYIIITGICAIYILLVGIKKISKYYRQKNIHNN